MTTQRSTFLDGEGDEFFRRNKEHLSLASDRPATNHLISFLKDLEEVPRHVVEVGCGNGSELFKICSALDCEGSGIEPSGEAVDAGNQLAIDLGIRAELSRGTAEEIPLADETADVVLFGFCLYLLDRRFLLPAMGEAFRVIRPGGFLAIVDFDPSHRHQRSYQHRPGVWSYKQDYAAIPLSTGLFTISAKYPMSHAGDGPAEDPDERIALTILRKEKTPYPKWRTADGC